jgi:drug/metabolite transporter (DMT)-like permease
MLIITRKKGISLFGPKKERKLLLIRACAGTCALITLFFAYKLIDPSECLALMHSSVIITSILARIFLKEKLTLAHMIALLLTVTGVFLISKPKFIVEAFSNITINDENVYNRSLNLSISQMVPHNPTHYFSKTFYVTLGIVLSLVSALGNSIVQVMLKKLCIRKVHYSIVTIYVTYVGFPVSAFIIFILSVTGASHSNFKLELNVLPLHIFYTFLAAVFGVLGQVFLNVSMNYEDASKIAIVKSMDLFFTFALQYIVLSTPIDAYSILGSISILSGAVLVLVFKIVSENIIEKKSEKSTQKNKFSIFEIINVKI